MIVHWNLDSSIVKNDDTSITPKMCSCTGLETILKAINQYVLMWKSTVD